MTALQLEAAKNYSPHLARCVFCGGDLLPPTLLRRSTIALPDPLSIFKYAIRPCLNRHHGRS